MRTLIQRAEPCSSYSDRILPLRLSLSQRLVSRHNVLPARRLDAFRNDPVIGAGVDFTTSGHAAQAVTLLTDRELSGPPVAALAKCRSTTIFLPCCHQDSADTNGSRRRQEKAYCTMGIDR